MSEVLSQEEIDALLSAISAGEVDPDEYTTGEQQKKVKIYDFRRPDKFSTDQLRTIQVIHEVFARLTISSLSNSLNDIVGVHIGFVGQLTYEEFVRSVPNPSTFAVISLDPLPGSAVIEIDPSVSFETIRMLFGGLTSRDSKTDILNNKFSRSLTDIELSVMEGIIVRMLSGLREAWSSIIDMRPRLSHIETNPQFVSIAAPTDMVLLMGLETRIGNVESMMNLCIPYETLKPVKDKLASNYWYSSKDYPADYDNGVNLDDLELELSTEICDRINFKLEDISNLKIGDEIKININPKQYLNGKLFRDNDGINEESYSIYKIKEGGEL